MEIDQITYSNFSDSSGNKDQDDDDDESDVSDKDNRKSNLHIKQGYYGNCSSI